MTGDVLFPFIDDEEELRSVAVDDARLGAGLAAVSDRLGIAVSDLARLPGGSLPVYSVRDRFVLKLYPPFDLEAHEREVRVLEILEGRLPVPTPAVEGSGELGGWGYLLASMLRGRSLDESWGLIDPSDRLRLCSVIGEALAVLHGLTDPRLTGLADDWDGFLGVQRRNAVARQRERGLEEPWLGQIDAFLESVPLRSPATSLLHTEVMREHVLVSWESGRPAISGLLDFESATVGASEYEFAAVGLFVTCGNAALLRALLRAYGYSSSDFGEELQLRFLTYTLLHRYSDLPWYLERLPPAPETRTLRELASHWWRM